MGWSEAVEFDEEFVAGHDVGHDVVDFLESLGAVDGVEFWSEVFPSLEEEFGGGFVSCLVLVAVEMNGVTVHCQGVFFVME